MVKCRYYDRPVVQNNTTPFIVREYRINSVYQPIVSGPTATASGYNGSVARYNSYRVEHYALNIRVASNENFSMSFGVIFNDTQPSTLITTYQQALTAITSSGSTIRGMVGNSAGNSKYESSTIKLTPGSVVGNPLSYFSDLDYTGSTGFNPAQAVWAAFILVSDGVLMNLTNGVFLDWDSSMTTRFYSPLPLA
jgi:hypothetical protein